MLKWWRRRSRSSLSLRIRRRMRHLFGTHRLHSSVKVESKASCRQRQTICYFRIATTIDGDSRSGILGVTGNYMISFLLLSFACKGTIKPSNQGNINLRIQS